MTFLYILGAVLILLILILICPAGVRIVYDGDFKLFLIIGFLKIKLLPSKKKVKLRDYTPKALAKKAKKEEKKRLRAEAKAAKKKSKTEGKKTETENEFMRRLKDPDIRMDFIAQLYDMLTVVADKFAKRLKIKFARLYVAVGTGDAAKTAIVYGCVCQAAGSIATLLSQFTSLRRKDNTSITVTPDFIADKTVAAADIAFTVRIGQIFGFLFDIRGVIKEIIKLI